MIHKSELRHGNFYLKDNSILLYSIPCKEDLIYAYEYVVNLDPIVIDVEVFHKIKVPLRNIFDSSAKFNLSVSLYFDRDAKCYNLIADEIKIKEINYLHELQNIIHELYEKEIEFIGMPFV